jgi:hypothetical protein
MVSLKTSQLLIFNFVLILQVMYTMESFLKSLSIKHKEGSISTPDYSSK